MSEALTECITPSDIRIMMNMFKYLGNDSAMDRIGLGFSARSNTIFKYDIGRLYEFLVMTIKQT